MNLAYWAAQKYVANAAYGVAKAATDRLTAEGARAAAARCFGRDTERMRHTRRALVVAEAARAHGFTDVDGAHPTPLTLATA